MLWNRLIAPTGIVLLLVLLSGCATTRPLSQPSTAATPRERARDDQIASLAEEDAGKVKTPTRTRALHRSSTFGRQTGQGVVDQPARP